MLCNPLACPGASRAGGGKASPDPAQRSPQGLAPKEQGAAPHPHCHATPGCCISWGWWLQGDSQGAAQTWLPAASTRSLGAGGEGIREGRGGKARARQREAFVASLLASASGSTPKLTDEGPAPSRAKGGTSTSGRRMLHIWSPARKPRLAAALQCGGKGFRGGNGDL